MGRNSAEEYIYATKWVAGEITIGETPSSLADRVFLVPPAQVDVEESLRQWYPDVRICVLGRDRLDFAEHAKAKSFALVSVTPWAANVDEEAILAVFNFLKGLVSVPVVNLDILTVCAVSAPAMPSVTHPTDSVYLGLGQTLAHEFPDWHVRCLSLSSFSRDAVASALNGTFAVAKGAVICLDGTRYWNSRLEPEVLRPAVGNQGFKRGGTYLILGATGGIGGAFGRYLARQYGARLILTGRRPEARDLVGEVERLGGTAVYEPLELADPIAVRSLLDRHTHLDGIIHSAMVLDDSSMLRMTQRQLLDVLRPKLHGCMNLAKALVRRELDFVLMFSSIQSYIANPGQANYTAACQAQDSVGALMRDVFMTNVKVVNWAFWGSIGVVASDAYRERMRKLEIGSIEIDEGVAIVESLLVSSTDQIAVIKASSRALNGLRILPRDDAGAVHANFDADATGLSDRSSPIQPDHILPLFQAGHPRVQRNKAASDALQRHARFRLHNVGIPALVPEKLGKLAAALRRIPPAAGPSRDALLQEFPEMAGHVALLDACVDNYNAIFSEMADPLAVMFPDGSFKLVEPVYRNNPIADYFNDVVAQTVSAFVRRRPNETVRVLEVGAGTGSTTEFILPAIASANAAYTFTDISLAFLNKARRRFVEYPFVEYKILNVDRPLADICTYDVIVATNVIHATTDVGRTLTNLRSMMASNGVLILNEITACQDFATMTFGLTKGWWLSSDRSRIPDSPLLTGESWRSLLLEAGFASTGHHGSEDQQVIVASTSPPNKVSVTVQRAGSTTAGGAANGDLLERTEETEEYIRSVISSVLLCDVEEIDVHQPFSELGIDSLIAMELLEPFRKDFGYIPATVLFEYPTVAKLAAYLIESFNGKSVSKVGMPESHFSSPLQADAAPTKIEEAGKKELDPVDDAVVMISSRLMPRADDIAIVGMAGQFPAARDVDSFWRNLLEGRDCTTDALAERWSASMVGERPYATRAGLVEDVDAFDNAFFGITPIEAARMDPQERLFLQIAHQSVNDAGYSRQAFRGTSTGVFVGVMNGAYGWYGASEDLQVPSSHFWSIANRVSYLFDLKGPSMAVDTACSSSLTALHLACQALKSGDCDAALVGGVNLIVHPRQLELLCNMHMLSITDLCRPFGEGADGFVDGEGVCCLVAKRYADASAAGDRIFGVVRGTAINAGGQSNGYSAPNPEAQARVIGTALSRAGLLPSDLDFVEAHGTGTELGDPIEVRGLTAALADAPSQSIALGSVKGNIGHLESAAGVAGVVKALLQVHHGVCVPTLNSENENVHLQLELTPFRLQRSVQEFRTRGPAVGSVSSFGAGGANAHAVLQSVERTGLIASTPGKPQIVLFSARTESSLQNQIDSFRVWLARCDAAVEAISYTSCCGRDHYRHRVGYVFQGKADLLALLEADLQEIKSRRQDLIEPQTVTTLVRKCRSNGLSFAEAQKLVDAHVQGVEVPWHEVFPDRKVTSHPRYVFDKTRFWVTDPTARLLDRNALVRSHCIAGNEIAPAAWALSELLERSGSSALRSVTWMSTVGDLTQVRFADHGNRVALVSNSGQRHCEATPFDERGAFNLDDLGPQPGTTRRVDNLEIYNLFEQQGYRYKGDLRRLGWAEIGPSMVKGFIVAGHHWQSQVSPALLDAGLQLAILMPELHGLALPDEIMVPYHLEEISILSAPTDQAVYSYCRLRKVALQEKRVVYDVYFTDVNRRVLVAMRGLTSVVTNKRRLMPMSPVVVNAPTEAVKHRDLVEIYDLA